MEGDNLKRKRTFRQQQPSRKQAKTDDDGGLKSGFGAKMLAKMGYKGTGGLGSDGSGIAEPIQVQLRGTKGGVGAVSEKSEQQKREERRKAEANGETYMDSSEEERVERKKKAKAARATAPTRPKKTLFELEASGMHVPLALQSIVDATTGESTPTAGVRLRGADIPFENALQARVRRDLNSFSEAFEELQLESQAIPPQEGALHQELDVLEKRIKEIEDIGTRLQSLRSSNRIEDICDSLKDLHATYPSRSLHRESVAAIHPPFNKAISSWSPLEDALESVAVCLSEVIDIIQPRGKKMVSQTYTQPSDSLVAYTVVEENPVRRGYSSPYETMMLKMWLPTVSSAVTQWDVTHPYPLIRLMEVWQPLLPAFVAKRVLDQVTRKLSTSIHDWNPRKFKKSPHTWIIEWLPYLASADLDPKGSGLVAEIKRKIRHALQSIDLSKGPLPGMDQWRKVFGRAEFERLLTSHLVPRLATHLRDNFEVNPAEQELAPLEAVFAWKEFLPANALAEILRAEFFGKFLEIIHQWMSSEGMVHEEVLQWLKWWRELFGEDLNNMPSVSSGWDEAYTLINQALDLGDARLTELPTPRQERTRDSPEPNPLSKSINKEPPRVAQVEETTFRDVVEEFCAEENLLMIPLREAHETTGLPLFRITASATGRGGAVAYIKGDVLWAQNKKDKTVWEPIGVDEGLVAKAEGK